MVPGAMSVKGDCAKINPSLKISLGQKNNPTIHNDCRKECRGLGVSLKPQCSLCSWVGTPQCWRSLPFQHCLALLSAQSCSQSTKLTARQQTYWWKHLDFSLEPVIAWTEFLEAGFWAFLHIAKTAEEGFLGDGWRGMSLVRRDA